MTMQVLDNADMASIMFRLQNLETAANQMQVKIAEQGQEIRDLKTAAAGSVEKFEAMKKKEEAMVCTCPSCKDAKKVKEAYKEEVRMTLQEWEAKDAKKRQDALKVLETRMAVEAQDSKEAQEAKEAKEAKEAQETKAAQEAKEAKEAKDPKKSKDAKEAKDIAIIEKLAKQLRGRDIPGISWCLAGVDKTTVVSSTVEGLTLLDCLSVFEDCGKTSQLITAKFDAMNILLLYYPWSQAQIDAAMNKFLPLVLTGVDESLFRRIVNFKHEVTNKPLVTFDQVQKVVASENLFSQMSAQNVKLMVSLMDQTK